MTYSFTKPDAGPSPALDASQIQTNFSQFALKFVINHVALNLKYQGDHTNVIFTEQSTDPGVTQDLDVLYTKLANSKAGIQPQLFVQIPEFLPIENDTTKSPNIPMQLTYNTVNLTNTPNYQSFLAGGYFIYFGSVIMSGTNHLTTITLSPAPTTLLIALAQSNGLGLYNASTLITSNTTFNINSSLSGGSVPAPSTQFTWLAIGTV